MGAPGHITPRKSPGTPFCISNRHHPLSPKIPCYSWPSATHPLVYPDSSDYIYIYYEDAVVKACDPHSLIVVAVSLKRALTLFATVVFLRRASRNQLQTLCDCIGNGVFHQQVNMIGGHHVIEEAQAEAFPGFKQPM